MKKSGRDLFTASSFRHRRPFFLLRVLLGTKSYRGSKCLSVILKSEREQFEVRVTKMRSAHMLTQYVVVGSKRALPKVPLYCILSYTPPARTASIGEQSFTRSRLSHRCSFTDLDINGDCASSESESRTSEQPQWILK